MQHSQANSNPVSPKAKNPYAHEHDIYLKLVSKAQIPVNIHFLDGDTQLHVVIKQVGMFTLLVWDPLCGDVLVYKNALKKIVGEAYGGGMLVGKDQQKAAGLGEKKSL